MAIIIGTVLAILSIAVILYPFVKSRNARPGQFPVTVEDSEGPELESIYEAIRTLELEHQLGNIPRGLYQEQLDAYRIQAALALKRQMEAQRKDTDWVLEQEILVARASLAHSNGHAARCANCGSAISDDVTQCPECNAELRPNGHDARGQRQS